MAVSSQVYAADMFFTCLPSQTAASYVVNSTVRDTGVRYEDERAEEPIAGRERIQGSQVYM